MDWDNFPEFFRVKVRRKYLNLDSSCLNDGESFKDFYYGYGMKSLSPTIACVFDYPEIRGHSYFLRLSPRYAKFYKLFFGKCWNVNEDNVEIIHREYKDGSQLLLDI